ncbi:helix-turn-helix domain-containing protein [Isoptericola sp. b441]|uniref:Helix-turn-helix domain-containing protein n=1 Tax=Actinotalea lenta TaxID=3064654 RepID=A0ABT9D4Y7_9CELL|nr:MULTISPECIES: helix-turn-helix domain-containing protein [unclassified Isoptericola]MDO8105766.1 helix-turn-helix domain-containing protein [Isoptericola sp. b441]MDO8122471.1 helix-turn-helix domain-containing protein [Isoptericola sp. b490]
MSVAGRRPGRSEGTRPAAEPVPASRREGQGWTLLTSHGRVLLLIAREPDLRLRDIAERARITERSAASIVHDLEVAGYVTKERVGRRNRYVVHGDLEFRHPAEGEHRVGELIEIFADD